MNARCVSASRHATYGIPTGAFDRVARGSDTRAEHGDTPAGTVEPPMETHDEYVLRTVEERGVRFVRLWFVDVLGLLK